MNAALPIHRPAQTRAWAGARVAALGPALVLAAALAGCAPTIRLDEPSARPAATSSPAPDTPHTLHTPHTPHAPITPLAGAEPGRLPGDCTRVPAARDIASTDYVAQREAGRIVLHAQAHDAAAELRCPVRAAAAPPKLRWRWRTDSVIAGATVADPASDDAPARVFVEFDSPAGPRRLYYVWDGMLTAGELVTPVQAPAHRYLIVESGADGTGRWLSYERNLHDDAVRAFGQVPGPVVAVGVLTDSDALHARAQAWYGDLTLGAVAGTESGR